MNNNKTTNELIDIRKTYSDVSAQVAVMRHKAQTALPQGHRILTELDFLSLSLKNAESTVQAAIDEKMRYM